MIERTLEPEVVDEPKESSDYNQMDHQQVNRQYVDDLIAAGFQGGDVADLGAGTALIAIELCQREIPCYVMANDAAVSMLELARLNVEVQGLMEHIQLHHGDSKDLDFPDDEYDWVISNSLIHHIPDPKAVIEETLRIAKPGGSLFFRDLLRPESADSVEHLVSIYAAGATKHQAQLLRQSLHASFRIEEIQEMVAALGFDPAAVRQTSDRHWTWTARVEN